MGYGESGPASSVHGEDLLALLVVGGLLVIAVAVVVAIAVHSIRAARRPLRRCPVCAASAVRSVGSDPVDALHVRLRLQCGQCGTWRQLATTTDDARWHAHRLEADRRRIGHRAGRLAARDVRAFRRTLRTGVCGAEDFVARTRRLPGPARRTHEPGGGER